MAFKPVNINHLQQEVNQLKDEVRIIKNEWIELKIKKN